MMTDRERWLRTLHYESVDHVPDEEFGYWQQTLREWHKQGLPEWVDSNPKADRYFGFARRAGVPVNLGLIPPFESKTLEETDRYRIIQDSAGVKYKVFKDGTEAFPHFLEFPIKGRDDWLRFRERLNPDDPRRYPSNWDDLKGQWEKRDYPLGINLGSLFGWLRNWMGIENIAIACVEQPDWIHEMMEYITEFILRVIERAVREVRLDFGAFWEDMCYKGGPLISPKMFKEFMVPRYKRIVDFVRQHSGADIFYVDCDGNILQLVELWLEAGVNCMFPCEVVAGSDPWVIRKEFGTDVLMLGGVDKTKLIAGKEAILQELKRLEKLVEMGGYIPHVDHRVPPDVTFENYRYYLREKRRMFGIPEPDSEEYHSYQAQAIGISMTDVFAEYEGDESI